MQPNTLVPLVTLAYTSTCLATKNATSDLFLPATSLANLSINGTWLENVAMRPNGDILMTLLMPTATLYTLKYGDDELEPVHEFEGANGLIGITKTGQDSYLVTAQNFSSFITPYPNTTALWEVSYTNISTPSIRKVANAPEALLYNGMAAVNPSGVGEGAGIVLIADAFAGQVVRLDMATGEREVVLDTPELKPPTGVQTAGINGVKIRDSYLYFNNAASATFYRLPITTQGYPSGPLETLITIYGLELIDDFCFDEQGNIWGMAAFQNRVFVVPRDEKGGYVKEGGLRFVAGRENTLEVPLPTSCVFAPDWKTVFVMTAGGIAMNNGTVTVMYEEPGRVIGIDTTSYFDS
ncbi:hypothetical protein GGR57DRAFT_251737 [Xylariaceae sp. FL1272]|nr:hypothetical protein GGR57DRAFT_251737 [Xylariaceae sp. FL1272]